LKQPLSQLQSARLKLIRSTSEFETGLAVQSIAELQEAVRLAAGRDQELEFAATLALFSRESQFLAPAQVLPTLGRLRQLAASLGNPNSLASLHLAVARLEAYRGHCLDARRHLEISRAAAAGASRPIVNAAILLVDASLESIAGNLQRATASARQCFDQSRIGGFGILEAGAITNLGFLALCRLDIARARSLLNRAVEQTDDLSFIRLAALDNLLRLALSEDDLDRCDELLRQCSSVIDEHMVPKRSWYDFAHQVTRCSVLAHIKDWEGVVELGESLEREIEVRQFRSLRTAFLCASARALAHLGEFSRADDRLTAATRACPRGAVEPLVGLESATAVFLTLSGEHTRGAAHFERALSAARATGNRLQEQEVQRDRLACGVGSLTADLAAASNATPAMSRSTVLSDVATILGAGTSIDLLAHRAICLISGTTLGDGLRVRDLSGQEFQPLPSIESRPTLDGGAKIEIRGSDRLVALNFRSVESLEEVTMFNGLLELLKAAAHPGLRQALADGEQDLWPIANRESDDRPVFRSPRMVEILRVAIRLAATGLPILLIGETGTGKDVFARLVHESNAARRGPFVPFNCSSIPKDLIESQLFGHRRGSFTGAVEAQTGVIRAASGGTLFLDEIGDLDIGLQPKLLRFIESGEIHTVGDPRPTRVDVRIIAATHADLETQAAAGTFRRDLFFRLGAAQIKLPPLRERKDEIPELTTSFVARFSREAGRSNLRVSDDLIAALLLYDWPGNIRQLANEMHRIVAMAEPGTTLTSGDLSPIITAGWTLTPKSAAGPARMLQIDMDQTLPQAIEAIERDFVGRAMTASGGRVAEAAQLLGISRKGLFLKRRRWGYLDDEPTE